MMSNFKLVFDMDNTLFFTDRLTNESYNYALQVFGFNKIYSDKRITRTYVNQVYPYLSNESLATIIDTKQEYFNNNLDKITINRQILNIIMQSGIDSCVLWTSADPNRVQETLKYYNLDESFLNIVYSNKLNIEDDLELICFIFQASKKDLLVFEDNDTTIKKLIELNVKVYRIDNMK